MSVLQTNTGYHLDIGATRRKFIMPVLMCRTINKATAHAAAALWVIGPRETDLPESKIMVLTSPASKGLRGERIVMEHWLRARDRWLHRPPGGLANQ